MLTLFESTGLPLISTKHMATATTTQTKILVFLELIFVTTIYLLWWFMKNSFNLYSEKKIFLIIACRLLVLIYLFFWFIFVWCDVLTFKYVIIARKWKSFASAWIYYIIWYLAPRKYINMIVKYKEIYSVFQIWSRFAKFWIDLISNS